MPGLTFCSVVLFISVLALCAYGLIKHPEKNSIRKLCIILGSGETILAFICFVAIPAFVYPSGFLDAVIATTFCLLSMSAVVYACLYPVKE